MENKLRRTNWEGKEDNKNNNKCCVDDFHRISLITQATLNENE